MVSVIIPSYNHEAFLKQRIDSVLNQTYQDYEVIILDDYSQDESRIIIDQYRYHPKITHILFNNRNSGSTFKQWNKGVELAKGELIWIAESDDVADKNFLQTLAGLFDRDPELGIAYCQSNQFSDTNNITGTWKSWTDDLDRSIFENDFILKGHEYISRFLIFKNTIPNASAVVFNKQKFYETGHANEEIKYCSDWLTWMKILTISNIAYSAKTYNSFRTHNESVISRVRKNYLHRYIRSFERLMREEFSRFLSAYNDKNLRSAKERNNFLIGNLYSDEGLFYLRQQDWKKGWSYIVKGSKKSPKLEIILKATFFSIRSIFIYVTNSSLKN